MDIENKTYVGLLNTLVQMSESPAYAIRKHTLIEAEHAIINLDSENKSLKDKITALQSELHQAKGALKGETMLCEIRQNEIYLLRDQLVAAQKQIADSWEQKPVSGCKLVPIEPTPEMLDAAWEVEIECHNCGSPPSTLYLGDFSSKECWKKMLENAPLYAQAAPADKNSVFVERDQLKRIHRDLDACQKVIWLAGGFACLL